MINNLDRHSLMHIVNKYNVNNILSKMTILFSVFLIIVFSLIILIIGISNRNVSIENKIITDSFKKENINTISQNVINDFFINKYEKLTIYSNSSTTNDDVNTLNDNNIITPNIRKKIYIGKTDLIQFYNSKNYFIIPSKMHLENNKINYIDTQELEGNLNDAIMSQKPFKINDDDLFLSGDNLYFIPNKNYLKITQNSHLIQTKINKQNQQKKYDIKSQQMEYIGEKNTTYFVKDVFFNDEENFVECQFSKVYLDDNNEIKDIFLQDKVKITQKKSVAIADYGFFDKQNNLVLLYKNVVLKSKDDISKTNIYIYNTEDKSSISINEYTPLTKKEKKTIINFIETNKNAKIEKISSSDNKNVYREKRAKVKLAKS